jgi:RNA polymerase sigma-70 factor (ECF subfamily)
MDFDAFTSGSEEAVTALIEEYGAPVIRYCYGIVCNYSDAEDAAQTAFIKVCLHRKRIRDPRALRAYLYRTAYRTCIDIIRKNRHTVLMPDAESAMQGLRTCDYSYVDTYDGGFPDELREALASLTPPDRALVVARAVHEMSYAELSALYGKSEAVLRKRYERARGKLADKLRGTDPAGNAELTLQEG